MTVHRSSTGRSFLYCLPLTEDGSPDNAKTYVRIPLTDGRGTILRFILEPGSDVKDRTLQTTYPIQGTFDRAKRHSVKFVADRSDALLQTSYYCDIELTTPGAYEYSVPGATRKGYIVVEPCLYQAGVQLPLDAVVIQSMISKWMGPLESWEPHIELVKHTGYNMIHFAPMQQRGSSDSPYSIHDQLLYADDLFTDAPSRQDRLERVAATLSSIQKKHDILCLSDVVWNHTSHDSPWLKEHPEAGYNLKNSPHLVPAWELDSALVDLSSKLKEHDLPTWVNAPEDAEAIVSHIKKKVLPDLRLWEYRVLDRATWVTQFSNTLKQQQNTINNAKESFGTPKERAIAFGERVVCTGHPGTRFNKTIDLQAAVSFISALPGEDDPNILFAKVLDEYNLVLFEQYDDDVKAALDNILSRLIFTRIEENGPKLGEISARSPLIESYFTRLHPDDPALQLANNGWIWNADPMRDFAGPDSSAYLRREVICWGDCVKLRYGQKPEDSPWLWQHMRTYTQQVASMFQGIRIDNCHSTPLHVAEYLLDVARTVNPNLYVLAELFTGSPEMDNVFVSRLGIHALLREAMQAWDPHELSRLVHRHGGKPVGSMDQDIDWQLVRLKDDSEAWMIPITHGSMPRALFMDCTHDNQTPYQKRTAEDTLPNAALVAFSNCATGSVKGYDEVYPRLLDVVGEKRRYSTYLEHPVGIVDIKSKLHKLHYDMCLAGYAEVHVHHESDYILVHRQHPETHDGYLLIARTAFPGHPQDPITPIRLHRTHTKFLFGGSLKVQTENADAETKHLLGIPSRTEILSKPIVTRCLGNDSWYSEITPPDIFTPGSVYVFKTTIEKPAEFNVSLFTECDDSVVEPLTPLDGNIALYRCEPEERDASGGKDGVYSIPGYGSLVYAGLQGFMSVLRPIIRDNDLGHPFCDNLRQGPWAMGYITGRLERYMSSCPQLGPLHQWLDSRFNVIRGLPSFLVPKYFAMTVHTAYSSIRKHLARQLLQAFKTQDPFLESLALTTVQMHALLPSTGLHPTKPTPSLAAGLPHFTSGCMRTWGRDVFISLRGLLMVTRQFEGARAHILGFASTLKHGLIPNLLDSGRNPRYNARDAVWFLLQAVQDYYHMAPDGHSILQARVPRRFPADDRHVPVEEGFDWDCSMEDLIQEIMQRHAQGIHFREHNAGPDIDRQMSDQGFNIDIEVDWRTGVIAGGSIWNCGTWMDKMGESIKAGNKGYPGTPRDGAPVEITGLVKSTLRWLLQLQEKKEFAHTGVEVGDRIVTYKEWNDLLQANFERVYYIPEDPSEDSKYEVDPRIIHRRGIYKDVYKATEPYTEYQFRPNLCVAMTVAPELFDAKHAQICLANVKKILAGPLGMRTLDPGDMRYRPYYVNSDDSDDFDTAKGRNYHQGPEWVWPVGYYLRAAHLFKTLDADAISRTLRPHRREIETSVWAGLPELTNKDGAPCYDSCHTQAWSSSCLLDLFYDTL